MNYLPPYQKSDFTLWDLSYYLRFHAKGLSAAAGLLTLRALVVIVSPWSLKVIIDNVVLLKPLPDWIAEMFPGANGHPFWLLNILAIVMLVLGFFDSFLGYHGNRLLLKSGQQVIYALRIDLFKHLQTLSLSYFKREKIGTLIARLGGDVQSLQEFVVSVSVSLFEHLLIFLGISIIMFFISWQFACMMLAFIPLLFWVSNRYRHLIRQASRKVRKSEGDLWGMVQEIISNIHIVQAYNRETFEEKRYADQSEKILKSTMETVTLQTQFGPLIAFIISSATVAVAWFGTYEIFTGSITAGVLIVFLSYLKNLTTPIRQFGKLAGVFGKASVAAERIGDLFSEASDIKEPNHPVMLPECRGKIEFNGVYFGYHPGTWTLKEINLTLGPGEKMALVGSTGSGKSTLASLIPRFYDPAKGKVLLDGNDLKSLCLSQLRSNIAIVLQESLIFYGTVWENIAYGRPGSGRAQVIEAAKRGGVVDLFESMENGFDTLVGEKGRTLSGGQRQVISIVRAMLRDAPILILDEPTSGLDAMMEKRVMAAIKVLSSNRTTLLIAHRLTTASGCDRILVMHEGAIVESGEHQSLIEAQGIYFNLWKSYKDAPVYFGPRSLPV